MIREMIKIALYDKRITQKRCAWECDLSPQKFNDFLRGRRNLPYEDLDRVCEFLQIMKK